MSGADPLRLCPTCGEPTEQGFDGGNDLLYEFCIRVRQLLSGEALKTWWADHDRRCPGPGKCKEGPPVAACDFYAAPPRWLAEALAADGPGGG